jgi:sirohydrochlorin cobaltochelatase
MKNKTVKALALLMTVTTVSMMGASSIYASDTETTTEAAAEETEAAGEESADADQQAADNVAALIDKIYVQERTETTDDDCKAAKEAWDALTDAQKELVEGENASPDYFGLDTGDATKDDARNADEIGENELLVVSFGTSYNDSRVEDIKGIEDALQEAYPDWAVRRAFTAQIIINHVQARDGEVIDNMQQALDRAVENGVKNLVVQPTHLMHGAEYDEMAEVLEQYQDKFESVAIAEPMLGEVGDDATVINEDKAAVAQAVADAAVQEAGFDSMEAAAEDGTAFVFLGHGTSHTAKVSYSQMQTQMEELGFKNAFIGTVEGEPEDTACEAVIEKVKEAGYKKVILRPLMVVAGDHANNDMAGAEDDSWKSMFEASGNFDSVEAQIAGLGRIDAVKQLYVEHTKAAIDSLGTKAATEDEAAEAETAEAETEAAEE